MCARESSVTATTFAVDILHFYFVAFDKTNEISKRTNLFFYLRIKIAGSAKLKRSSSYFFGQVTTAAHRVVHLCVRS